MKKVAMLMCFVLALGWISNTGYLSIRYDNGVGLRGIPMKSGYSVIFDYNGVKTSVASINPKTQWDVFHSVSIYVNGKFVLATPLGNGFLFQFKEIKSNVGGLPNR